MKAIAGAIAILAVAGAALAADLPIMPPLKTMEAPAPAPARQETGFENLGADCIEAFDGCRRYTRAGDGLFDAANNIGIACQPQPLSCTKRR